MDVQVLLRDFKARFDPKISAYFDAVEANAKEEDALDYGGAAACPRPDSRWREAAAAGLHVLWVPRRRRHRRGSDPRDGRVDRAAPHLPSRA
jgi:hypothetical protein